MVLDFPADFPDAVPFVPVNFRVAEIAIVVLDQCFTFHLPPAIAAVTVPKVIRNADTTTDGDDFNIANGAEDFEVLRRFAHVVRLVINHNPITNTTADPAMPTVVPMRASLTRSISS